MSPAPNKHPFTQNYPHSSFFHHLPTHRTREFLHRFSSFSQSPPPRVSPSNVVFFRYCCSNGAKVKISRRRGESVSSASYRPWQDSTGRQRSLNRRHKVWFHFRRPSIVDQRSFPGSEWQNWTLGVQPTRISLSSNSPFSRICPQVPIPLHSQAKSHYFLVWGSSFPHHAWNH